MKLLASITIVMAIPTIISGFFGMNVGIPLENMRGAFYIILRRYGADLRNRRLDFI